METLVLTDKTVQPDDKLIFSIIGRYKDLWVKLFSDLSVHYPDASPEWHYYNDGKSWLLKTVRKKKTLFWTAVHEDTFRITFYFGDKAESLIENSPISAHLKDSFKNGKKYGKIRALSLKIFNSEDLENVMYLMDIRTKTV